VAQFLPALQVLPHVGRVLAAAVDDHLGEPGVADQPDHRAVSVLGGAPAVDGPLGEQRAALVGHVRRSGRDDDQLAAEGVDLDGDLAAREHCLDEVDDQRAEPDGQPGVPPGHPTPGPDHFAEPGRDFSAARGFHVGVGNVAVGQVARERGQFAQGPRGVRGVEPFRVLGARQAADGHRAAQPGGGTVPVRVRGAQVKPLFIANLDRISRQWAVMAYFRHGAYRKRKTRYVAS